MLLMQIFPGYHETIYQKVTRGLAEMNTRTQAQKCNRTEPNVTADLHEKPEISGYFRFINIKISYFLIEFQRNFYKFQISNKFQHQSTTFQIVKDPSCICI